MRYTTHVGFVGYTPKDLKSIGSTGCSVAIYNNGLVYDVTTYFSSPQAIMTSAGTQPPSGIMNFISGDAVSRRWRELGSMRSILIEMFLTGRKLSLRNLFTIRKVDHPQSVQCQLITNVRHSILHTWNGEIRLGESPHPPSPLICSASTLQTRGGTAMWLHTEPSRFPHLEPGGKGTLNRLNETPNHWEPIPIQHPDLFGQHPADEGWHGNGRRWSQAAFHIRNWDGKGGVGWKEGSGQHSSWGVDVSKWTCVHVRSWSESITCITVRQDDVIIKCRD